ncbi:hypothetical protein HCG51_06290 [Tolypothrix sp. PCC 7910]|uniref:DUF5908 family protein n=1 Tax=Tolypothrix sp. PCC 7910 TaxID=2099387 RepID=UPI0014278B67|nr:DUF5908 family protein [Tolypothrix sp. PCC 7910]QIR36405.1 hypothetical protein HCG51_06290 [Tolypothrix sp. PCC 7910]
MPIEIRELVIKTSINDGQNNSSGGTESSDANDQDAIIAACVEQVLAILKEKSER